MSLPDAVKNAFSHLKRLATAAPLIAATAISAQAQETPDCPCPQDTDSTHIASFEEYEPPTNAMKVFQETPSGEWERPVRVDKYGPLSEQKAATDSTTLTFGDATAYEGSQLRALDLTRRALFTRNEHDHIRLYDENGTRIPQKDTTLTTDGGHVHGSTADLTVLAQDADTLRLLTLDGIMYNDKGAHKDSINSSTEVKILAYQLPQTNAHAAPARVDTVRTTPYIPRKLSEKEYEKLKTRIERARERFEQERPTREHQERPAHEQKRPGATGWDLVRAAGTYTGSVGQQDEKHPTRDDDTSTDSRGPGLALTLLGRNDDWYANIRGSITTGPQNTHYNPVQESDQQVLNARATITGFDLKGVRAGARIDYERHENTFAVEQKNKTRTTLTGAAMLTKPVGDWELGVGAGYTETSIDGVKPRTETGLAAVGEAVYNADRVFGGLDARIAETGEHSASATLGARHPLSAHWRVTGALQVSYDRTSGPKFAENELSGRLSAGLEYRTGPDER